MTASFVLIIGKFLGDSDLLLYRGTPGASDRGHIMVATPIDRRPDWSTAANSLDSFFAAYARHQGDKFWERQLS